ncbi:MAG: phospholipase D family protein [Chloroflexi bacterium]|nr:phospholipase D family protein [Chloroflexota bacterium]
MLEPTDRRLLLEALRPPQGYSLDYAVGTTFSLDLLALLTTPLAFALFDWQDQEGRPTADPLALLQAVRRYADRMAVFCQAGQIAIPRRDQLLYGYLETAVFEVNPPRGNGVFHPKVWLLRFTAGEDEATEARYRLLSLSRNLTFDRSWDTVLSLDGEVLPRRNALAMNHPLGDFVASLPGLARRPLPAQVQERIDTIAAEVRRVRFEAPDGLTLETFWPIGVRPAYRWPFPPRPKRVLVVSPFLSDGFLRDFASPGGSNVVISRTEALDELSGTVHGLFAQQFVLSDAASEEPQEAPAPLAPGTTATAPEDVAPVDASPESLLDAPLEGLHAKLFVVEEGWDARLWTGSANATSAAFSENVEFLVELRGRRTQFGVDALLAQPQGRTSFADLLQTYNPPDTPVVADAVQQRLERLVDSARRLLGQTTLAADVSSAGEGERQEYTLTLSSEAPVALPASVQLRCWPVTLREEAACLVGPINQPAATVMARFGPLSFEALTSFFAFSVTAAEGEREVATRFVLNVPLRGAPQDRRERMLRSLLRNRQQVLRFLLFLLAEGSGDMAGALLAAPAMGHGTAYGADGAFGSQFPLLELLLRALDRQPLKLDQVARLIEDLSSTEEGRQLLPDGWERVWQPIWTARGKVVQ